MALIGRLHPLLIHFPIALVDRRRRWPKRWRWSPRTDRWRTVAVGNVRAGAVFALFAAIAGWRLAATPAHGDVVATRMASVAGNRSRPARRSRAALATAEASTSIGARACGSIGSHCSPPERWWLSPGHLGGLLVWGANFLRP